MNTVLPLFDVVALAVCIFVLFAYHFLFYNSTVGVDGKLQLSFNLRNVVHWLHKHKEKSDPQSVTLAVQTLRNTILVAIFVGGNALNFAYNVTSTYREDMAKRQQVRSIILAILLFGSFLCWANVIRHASHLGYLIGTLDFEDKMDLKLLEKLPDTISSKNNGHIELSQNDSTLSNDGKGGDLVDIESGSVMSDNTRSRVQLYTFDRKLVIKKSEKALSKMFLYFRCVIIVL